MAKPLLLLAWLLPLCPITLTMGNKTANIDSKCIINKVLWTSIVDETSEMLTPRWKHAWTSISMLYFSALENYVLEVFPIGSIKLHRYNILRFKTGCCFVCIIYEVDYSTLPHNNNVQGHMAWVHSVLYLVHHRVAPPVECTHHSLPYCTQWSLAWSHSSLSIPVTQ